MSADIQIEVRGYSPNGARYRVYHAGAVLLESCRVPFCDAARALSKAGVTGRLRMSRVGRSQVDAEGLIAVLAAQTVSENERHGPKFSRFVAMEIEPKLEEVA